MDDVSAARRKLLTWYDRQARSLPWRVSPADRRAGVRPDPYRVWLSEIMLQQTTTSHAAPYFERFTRRWPTVTALAQAKDAEVMAAWAGLGYYARARNLLACARAVAYQHGGVFPNTESGLRALPGVGAYTAAAVAAIAFDQAANVVDGNVERVMSRLFCVETPLPAAKPALAGLALDLSTSERPGDWAQALMDLGATVCKPKSPLCLLCPLTADCEARAKGAPERYPRKLAKRERPHRFGLAYLWRRGDQVALVRRPPEGLLGGMLGLPTSEWTERPFDIPEGWIDAGAIEHIFTHFSLTLHVLVAGTLAPEDAIWTDVEEARSALPTVFKKALDRGLG